MGMPDVSHLSFGQWVAIRRFWEKQDGQGLEAPSDDEFDKAVMAARGVK